MLILKILFNTSLFTLALLILKQTLLPSIPGWLLFTPLAVVMGGLLTLLVWVGYQLWRASD